MSFALTVLQDQLTEEEERLDCLRKSMTRALSQVSYYQDRRIPEAQKEIDDLKLAIAKLERLK